MQSRFDVMTIGSATQDIFLQSAHFELQRDRHAPDGLDVRLQLGAKMDVDALAITTGGGATNAAATFARFGLKTACVSSVGRDPVGDFVLADLKKRGVDATLFHHDAAHQTATSVIFVAGHGHRSILTFRGASKHIRDDRIPWAKLAGGWLYITSLSGNSLTLLQRLYQRARSHNVRIAWNPGHTELEHGLKNLEWFLDRTAVLILNREEAALLTDRPTRHLKTILRILWPYPKTALVVTDGGRGAYVHDSCGRTWYAPPLKAKRINTTGAGDAFGSAFVAALTVSQDVPTGLAAGMLNATSVIEHMGAKAGILKRPPSASDLRRVRVIPFEGL